MRILAIGTAVVLAFDAAAFFVLARLLNRPFFNLLGLAFGIAAVLVLGGLYLHARRLEAIQRERRELGDELRSLNDFIHRR